MQKNKLIDLNTLKEIRCRSVTNGNESNKSNESNECNLLMEDKLLIMWLHLSKIKGKNRYFKDYSNIKELYEKDDFGMDYSSLIKYINEVNNKGIKIFINNNNKIKKLNSNYSPMVLYYIGNIDLLKAQIIGFVGSRRASFYGLECTRLIIEELRGKEIVTVSGGAYGIDRKCHEESIKNNIRTICVLGGGLLHMYPKENIPLFKRIVNNGGLILSEYPIDLRPKKYFFPERNRIIAKLSDILVVPEASKNSGSMHTVEEMVLLNKEVLVVPHDINRQTGEGNNELIKLGFNQLNSPKDILSYI